MSEGALEVTRGELENGEARRRPLTSAALVALDHASFAGAHFVASLLLARWLAPEAYGTFARAYALLLIGLALHAAFLSEPLLALGRGRFAACGAGYFAAVVRGHLALSLAFGAGFIGLLGVLGAAGPLADAGRALALGAPALLGVSLLRRACAVRMRWGVAATGGVLYAVCLAASLWMAQRAGVLSVVNTIVALTFASLVACFWMGARLGLRGWLRSDPDLASGVRHAHWRYGRFALFTILVTWIPWNLHYLVLEAQLGLAGIGALRALHNLLLPASHLSIALCTALLPLHAAHRRASREREGLALARRHAAAAAAATLLYVGVLAFQGEPLLALLYGDAFVEIRALAPWVAAVQIPVTVIAALVLLQLADGRSGRALLLWLPYAVLSLVLGAAGASVWGVEGFVFGMLLASSGSLPLAWLCHRGWLHRLPGAKP